ncbi:25991_t:CDS:2, partial [Dentiscutata erythropus]
STALSQQKCPETSKVNLSQNIPLQILQTFNIEEIRSNASAQKQAANSKNPELLDNIHNLVEYGSANTRRRKEAVKPERP